MSVEELVVCLGFPAFHEQRFVERLNAERRFGEELLQWIIKQEPEGKASVQALQKLKVEGLA